MRLHLTLIACLALTGCIAGAQQARSSTTVTRDTGVPGLERTTVESEQSGSYFGGQMPMAPGGVYGYGGYGHMIVTSGSCWPHPDACAVIRESTVIQPMTVVSTGGGNASVDTSDLEANIDGLKTADSKLAGGTILSLEQSCYAILKDPGMVPEAKREKIVAGCNELLKKSNTNTEEK